MKRKLLSSILALCLTLSLLAGAVSFAAAETATEPLTLKMLGVDSKAEVDGVPNYLSYWIEEDNPMWHKFYNDLLERGLKIEPDLIMGDQYQTTIAAQIAAGLSTDYLKISPLDTVTRLSMGLAGDFLAINDILEYSDGTAKEWFENGIGKICIQRQSLEDGKLYWINSHSSSVYQGQPASTGLGTLIRYDWLEKLGLPIPTTLDEFVETLRAFQEQDVNGDGLNDEAYRIDTNFIGIPQWFGIGTDMYYIDPITKTVMTPWKHEQIQPYIQFIKSLYDEGLGYLNLESTSTGTMMADNKLAGYPSWMGDFWSKWSFVVPEGEPAADTVGFMIQAVDGVEPLLAGDGQVKLAVSDAFAFTKQCDPKAAAIFLDYICTPEYSLFSLQGIEGVTFVYEEDGSLTRIREGHPLFNDMAKTMAGATLWNTDLVPLLRPDDDQENSAVRAYKGLASDKQIEVMASFYFYPYIINNAPDGDFAIATQAETDRLEELSTDLKTYTSELMTDLILGNRSFDKWDSYIADMERLGLNDMLEIYQARYERTLR